MSYTLKNLVLSLGEAAAKIKQKNVVNIVVRYDRKREEKENLLSQIEDLEKKHSFIDEKIDSKRHADIKKRIEEIRRKMSIP